MRKRFLVLGMLLCYSIRSLSTYAETIDIIIDDVIEEDNNEEIDGINIIEVKEVIVQPFSWIESLDGMISFEIIQEPIDNNNGKVTLSNYRKKDIFIKVPKKVVYNGDYYDVVDAGRGTDNIVPIFQPETEHVIIPESMVDFSARPKLCQRLKTLTFEEGVETINSIRADYIDCVYFPSTLKSFVDYTIFSIPSIGSVERFIVDENNPYFCSYKGNVCTKDKTQLQLAKIIDGNSVVPSGVNRILKQAYYCNKFLESVTLSKTLNTIDEKSFYKCWKLESIKFTSKTPPKEIGSNAFKKIADNYKIYVPKGTKATYYKVLKATGAFTKLTQSHIVEY